MELENSGGPSVLAVKQLDSVDWELLPVTQVVEEAVLEPLQCPGCRDRARELVGPSVLASPCTHLRLEMHSRIHSSSGEANLGYLRNHASPRTSNKMWWSERFARIQQHISRWRGFPGGRELASRP